MKGVGREVTQVSFELCECEYLYLQSFLYSIVIAPSGG